MRAKFKKKLKPDVFKRHITFFSVFATLKIKSVKFNLFLVNLDYQYYFDLLNARIIKGTIVLDCFKLLSIE